MAIPVGDTYVVASGQPVNAGRFGFATTNLTTFTLTSPTGGTKPYVIGHAFKKGDVPAGSTVVVAGAQATIKNVWSDGSAKFAILAGTAALVGGVAKTMVVASGAVPGGTNQSLAALKATGITASIGAGSFGTASWATTDWDTPFQTWVVGPQMSSWVYRKPIGTDAHLVAWMEVRLFATGEVEVLPWIENGYISVAAPTSKSATYTFTLGTTRFSQAINLPARCRSPLLSGTALSYWLGTDPQVTPKHDTVYMQSTNLVPSYRGTVATTSVAIVGGNDTYTITHVPPTTSFTPLQVGNWTYPGDAMGGTGYSAPIGLLPEHDALYLTCASPLCYTSVVMNSYGAGRYPTHLRDSATNLPLSFASFPYLSNNSSSIGQYVTVASGTSAPEWDIPHHPSIGYLAYLITGRFYHLEELQFAATFNYVCQVDTTRGLSGGYFQSGVGANTERGAAWAIRTLAQAATATPDNHALHSDFVNSLTANVDFYHGLYVAQTNNPYGWVAPYANYTAGTGVFNGAWWMQDFFTAATGYAKAMEPALPSATNTKLTAFFAWKAKSIVGRLGGLTSSDWLYRDAAEFYGPLAPSNSPDFVGGTGPWYASWGAAYTAAFGITNPGTAGDLRNANYPDPTSYWGNLQPAIAYAVQHGVAGAQTAYDRMVGAFNWSTLAAGFNVDCTWGIKPQGAASSSAGLPLWRNGQSVNEWREIANSALANYPPSASPVQGTAPYPAILDAWSGLSADTRVNRLWSICNGGHTDSSENSARYFDLALDSPIWVEVLASNTTSQIELSNNQPRYLNGRPVSAHAYYTQQFIEARNRAMRFGLGAKASSGNPDPTIDGFDCRVAVGTNGFDAVGTYPVLETFGTDWPTCKNPTTEDVFIFNDNNAVYKWTQTTNAITTLVSGGSLPSTVRAASAYDSTRNRIFLASGSGACHTFDPATRLFTARTLTGSYTGQVLQDVQAMVYEPTLDVFLVFGQGAGCPVYVVNPSTFATSLLTTTGSSGLPTPRNVGSTAGGPYTRVLYLPLLGGVVYIPSYAANAWFLRLH